MMAPAPYFEPSIISGASSDGDGWVTSGSISSSGMGTDFGDAGLIVYVAPARVPVMFVPAPSFASIWPDWNASFAEPVFAARKWSVATVPEEPLKPPSATPSNFTVPEALETEGSVTQKSMMEPALETDSTLKSDVGNDTVPDTALREVEDEAITRTETRSPTSKLPVTGESERVAACDTIGRKMNKKRNIIIRDALAIFFYVTSR